VVFGADALSDAAMLAITREFDYSESVFVLTPRDPAHGARIRIFTPGGELPFAGHPTVGAACAIARRAGVESDLRLELAAGLFPVRVREQGPAWFAEFDNPNLPEVTGPGPDIRQVELALGLPEGSVESGSLRPVRAGAGIDFIYARAPLAAVRAAKLDSVAWAALGMERAEGNLCGIYLVAPGGDAADADFHARMFAPHIGVPEDPATGSAAAGLPAHLLAGGELPSGTRTWMVEQGVEMGRPSRIRLTVESDAGRITALRIGGHAVPVMSGTIRCG